jgi:hypothetical protein
MVGAAASVSARRAVPTATASAASTTTTRAAVTEAVLAIPARSTPVATSTTRTATQRACSGQAYAPIAKAAAAHDAVLPTTKAHPARVPHHRPSRSRPYTYAPPDSGWTAASWAVEVALQ